MIKCHMCESEKVESFLDLGFSPPSDNFLTKEGLSKPETHYPLNVFVCKDCGLIQLGYIVPPEIMYNKEYPYESSTTKTLTQHFLDMAKHICEKHKIKKESLVIDIGSNVGVLLSGFKEQGMKVLGVDPSTNIAKTANERGIETLPDFFNSKTAKEIEKKKGKATVITATNVFAHIGDLKDLMNGVKTLLAEDGMFVIEAPYWGNLVKYMQYDTIYHEHLRYISVAPLMKFFPRFGMEIFDIEEVSTHGGSLRIFVDYKGKRKPTKKISELLNYEEKNGLHSIKSLQKFADEVKNHRKLLVELLFDLKKKGKRIVGIGAPAKGNTFLNYCKIDTMLIDYLTEKAKIKIGLFTPGMHIPVLGDEQLMKDKPDYALLLSWNYAKEIMNNLQDYSKAGGKFIIPIPKPHIAE